MNDPDGLLQNSSLSKKAYDEESDPKYQLYRNEYIEHQDLPSKRRRGRPGYAQREQDELDTPKDKIPLPNTKQIKSI